MASPMDIASFGSNPQFMQFVQTQLTSILNGNGYNPQLAFNAIDPVAAQKKQHNEKMKTLWYAGVFDDIKKDLLETLGGEDPYLQQAFEPTVAKMLGVDLKS